jgi:HK97 family phage major capsid protein
MNKSLPRPDEIQHRAIVAVDYLALETRADGDNRIPVALSSETAVPRWYGREILVHTREAISAEYMPEGSLPFLDSHDPTRQLGIIENVRLDGDRVLRGWLRMGNHPDAAWVEKDIRAGIRPNLSIGYRIDELVPDRDETFRVTRWTPMEGSTVSVPADITVGVGRAADLFNTRGKTDMSTEDHRHGHTAATLDAQRQAIVDIYNLAVNAGFEPSIAQNMVSRGLTVEQAKAELFERKLSTARPITVPGYLDLTDRDTQAFTKGFNGALLAIADRRPDAVPGVVADVSRTISQRLGRSTPGIFVPLDLSVRASVTGNVAGTTSLGGAGVQTSVMSLIELLRNRMLVKQLGATVLSGLTGTITFPRQITANSFSWTGENPSSGAAETAATLDNVTMSPKTAIGRSSYSRQLLIQASYDASAFVQNDIANVLAVGLDAAAIDGTGSSNQPLGIMRQTGVNTATFTGTNGGVPTWAELVQFEKLVEEDNALDLGSKGWIFTPGAKAKLKTVLKSTTAGSTFLWESDNTVNGYPAFSTNNMPSSYTAGTSTTIAHGCMYGVFSEALIGEWGGAIELVIDPFSFASQAMVAVTGIMLVDVGVRHPAAFAINKTLLVS